MATTLLLLLLSSLSIIISTTKAFAPPISSSRTSLPSRPLLHASNNDDELYDCLVIGGGISGSTLAHNLHFNSKLNILLTESRDYLGGNVQSVIVNDDDGEFIYEKGPNSFATQPSIVRIAYELGIDDQLVFANESLPPWVNYNDKLHPLPKGKGGKGPQGQLELVFGSNGILKFGLVGDLLSWPGKIRAGIGAFVGHPRAPENKEETIQEWIIRILGDEVFYRIIDPFVSGVYAGDPTTLSMKAALGKIARIEQYSYDIEWNKFGALFYGGLARQVELTKERKADPPAKEWVDFEYGNPGSFKRGLSTLPLAIEKELGDKVKLEWTLTNVDKNADGNYVATFDTPNGKQIKNAKSIVTTIPTHAMGNILEPVLPGSTDLFTKERSIINRKGIYYPPVAAVTLAYPKSTFKDIELSNDFGNLQNLPGFGLLNPRSEGVRTLGHLWSSSLFPGRCPDNYNILLNYIGGSRDPEIGTMSEEDIIAAVDTDLRKVLLDPDKAPEPKVLGIKVWPTATPQYELGHFDIMNELTSMESKNEGGGLWVCGNYRSGVAFPDCVTFGYDHAKVVKEYLDGKKTE